MLKIVVAYQRTRGNRSDRSDEGLDIVVDNAFACHLCGPGSNPAQGMSQGSGCPFMLGGFLWVLQFPPSRWTTLHVRQHSRLQECVYKFHELSL